MCALKVEDIAALYGSFEAPISRYDCGKQCAPHNGGEPVCCSTRHAVPVVFYAEWQYLKERTDLWHAWRGKSAAERRLREDLPHDCRLIECKGASFCERENRSLSCRTFPFFPYITRQDEFLGLTYYWSFEPLCWVISNLQIVERRFVREFVRVHEALFEKQPRERDTYRDYSAVMRRVFSRWRRPIPLLHRDGRTYAVDPRDGELIPTTPEVFGKHGVYAEAPNPFTGK